jgi:alkylated DNA repair dioxygenase AlkB
MFHPDMRISAMVSVIVLVAFVFGVMQHRRIAPPKSLSVQSGDVAVASGDIEPVLAEAKRDIG